MNVVTMGTERGKSDVLLFGALPAILAFTQNNTAAHISENVGRILVVAGAGLTEAPTITKHA